MSHLLGRGFPRACACRCADLSRNASRREPKAKPDLGECLEKCGKDKLKQIGLDVLFCLLYPEICEQYGYPPCSNVYDMDSCQACADQKMLQCMMSNPPLSWIKCYNEQRAGYIKCLQKHSRLPSSAFSSFAALPVSNRKSLLRPLTTRTAVSLIVCQLPNLLVLFKPFFLTRKIGIDF